MRYVYLQSFILISLIVSELCPGQSSKCKNEQRAPTSKLGKADLWFLYNALLLNEIYLHTKFHVDISCCYKVMSRTRKTDGRTDGENITTLLIELHQRESTVTYCSCSNLSIRNYLEYLICHLSSLQQILNSILWISLV
jgi:hypothetical protein